MRRAASAVSGSDAKRAHSVSAAATRKGSSGAMILESLFSTRLRPRTPPMSAIFLPPDHVGSGRDFHDLLYSITDLPILVTSCSSPMYTQRWLGDMCTTWHKSSLPSLGLASLAPFAAAHCSMSRFLRRLSASRTRAWLEGTERNALRLMGPALDRPSELSASFPAWYFTKNASTKSLRQLRASAGDAHVHRKCSALRASYTWMLEARNSASWTLSRPGTNSKSWHPADAVWGSRNSFSGE
mmetsp:Transcript_10869/g.30515  ORF Transcript_10869/g.30515 Transcript_10869/m.30515 type:complete len:241 (-) Transcript_10869:998-1720(-)